MKRTPPGDRMIDVLDCIDELVDHTTHREPFTMMCGTTIVNDYWTTTHPSLLDQLAEAIEPTTSTDTGSRGAATSKPTARIEAIDALRHIDTEAARWLRHLGHDDPHNTAECVRHLAPHAHNNRDLTHDIRRWWTLARIHTGWDTPAWRPANTCPNCDRRGGLRIRLANHIGHCIECDATWDPDTIGLLADWIREENRDTTEPVVLTLRA